jgi:adenosylhomocysteine nucleosidase
MKKFISGGLFIFFMTATLVSALSGCGRGEAAGDAGVDAGVDGGTTGSRIAILCAFSLELKALFGKMEIERTESMLGRTVYLGHLGGKDVVMVASGISEVNAAMMAQAVISRYNPKAVIFSGVAGAIDPDLHVSDVMIPEQWAQYQEQVMARSIPGGYDPSGANEEILFPNYDMFFPLLTCLTSVGGTLDQEECGFWFQVDPRLLNIARRNISGIELERCLSEVQCLNHQPVVRVGGNAGTGPSFMDNDGYRSYLWDNFKMETVDRESAVVAHVARSNNVPFITMRAVSDLAGNPAESKQFAKFADLAARNVTHVLVSFLQFME